MISCISFRNFLAIVAVLPYSVSAFNPANINKPSLPIATTTTTDAIDGVGGGLKAATIDNAPIDIEDAWSSVTQMIHSKFDEHGGEDALSDEAKDEIIGTVVAGSVLGTVVGSPLVVGAALGYAGSQMLQTEEGEKAREALGQAGKEVMKQANSAIDFTKKELENEKDLSKVSAKILMAMQDKAGEIQEDLKGSPQRMAEKLPGLVTGLVAEKLKENVLHTVESEEFKSLPKRSFNSFMAFMESDEVKKVKSEAMKALKDGQSEAMKAIHDGLESEEVKALQSRASKAVKEGIDSASSKITKA